MARASQSLLSERMVIRISQSLLPNGAVCGKQPGCGKGKNPRLVIPLTPPKHTYEEEPREDPSNTEYQVTETSHTEIALDKSTIRGTSSLMKNEVVNMYHLDPSLVRAIRMVLAEKEDVPKTNSR